MRIKLSTRTLSLGKTGGKVARVLKAAFKDAQPKIAALVIDRVTTEANKTFKDLAPLYVEALNKPDSVKISEDGVEVKLATKIAQAMDDGAPAFDMKKALLAKAKKFSKKGVPYVDVPFKHTTSGARGTTQLPAAVKQAITARAALQQSSGQATQVTRLPMKTPGKSFTRVLFKKRFLIPGLKKVEQKVQHKRGLHDDLVRRRTKVKGQRATVSYSTVRRITANSAASSWWHPGFKGAGLLKKTMPKLKTEIDTILRDSISKVRGGKL